MSVGNESWVARLDLKEGDPFESLDLADQVDVICDAFERQWQNGSREPVERFLEGAPLTEETLNRLHQELIPLEIEFRSDAGEAISIRDYLVRIPEQALFIARFLCDEGQEFELNPPPKRIGSYWLLELVGRGSFGVVYRAYDKELDRFVAVKLPTTGLGDEESVRRFQREAKNAGRLAHPGIVPIYFVKQDKEGRPFIVSEFVDGTTLDVFVSKVGRLNSRTAASLVAQVAESLEYAHGEGIIHRDLKPSNVILEARKIGDSTQDGTPDDSLRPKVLDFGLARRQDGDASTSIHGAVIGTPAYMSPEQARGDASVDHRADVYSLGAILYEILMGRRCFPGETFSAVLLQVISEEPELPPDEAAAVPKDLLTICLKCLSKEPADRYARAADLADDLRRWLRHEEIVARPLSRAAKTARWVRRNAMLTGGITSAVVFIAMISLLFILNSKHSDIIKRLESAPAASLALRIEETRESLSRVPWLERAILWHIRKSGVGLAAELRFRIVLGDELPSHADRFYKEIDRIPITELSVLAKYLPPDVHETLKNSLRKGLASSGDGLHETVCLAALEEDWPGFKDLAGQIVDVMVISPEASLWAEALQPISKDLLPTCKAYFVDRKDSQQAMVLAEIVVELAAKRPEDLIWFLERSQGPATRLLVQHLQTPDSLQRVSERLDALSNLPLWHEQSEEVRRNEALRLEQEVQQRVNLALCYGLSDGVKSARVLGELLKSDEDPRPRTHFIQRVHESIPLTILSQHVTWQRGERDDVADDVLYCVILAISLYEQKDFARDSKLSDRLLDVYRWHPDSGVHCAAGYCLRKLGCDLNEIHRANPHLQGYRTDRDWYHTSFGACMIVIPAGDYAIWYVRNIAQPLTGQVLSIPIHKAFAVSATAMTEREFASLAGESNTKSENPQLFAGLVSVDQKQDRPPKLFSLIDACNLVDKQENLIEESCFAGPPPEGAIAYCDLTKLGFRLPVAQEWLVCCTAGAWTPRYFGGFQTDVANFIGVVPDRFHHSVFRCFPNRLGFFGLYDNSHDLTLTKSIYGEELRIDIPPPDDVVLRADENLTYHGGDIRSLEDAKFTFSMGPSPRRSRVRDTGLRLTQTLPVP